jgi:hypothetical protein
VEKDDLNIPLFSDVLFLFSSLQFSFLSSTTLGREEKGMKKDEANKRKKHKKWGMHWMRRMNGWIGATEAKKDTDVWRQPLALTEVCSQAKAALKAAGQSIEGGWGYMEYGLGWMDGRWRGERAQRP